MAYERPRSRAVWRRRRWTMKHSRRQTRPTYVQSAAPCRRTVVATARPSISVWQTPWRANTLAVGRFGEQLADASESLIRQTRPTYGQSAVPCRRTVVAKPARLSAYGKHHGLRTSPRVGRFGGERPRTSKSLIRQTRPTYVQSAAPCRRTVVAKPARLSA